MQERHPIDAERLPSKRQAAVISFALIVVPVGGAVGDYFRQDKQYRQWPYVSMASSMLKALPWVALMVGLPRLYKVCSKIFT